MVWQPIVAVLGSKAFVEAVKNAPKLVAPIPPPAPVSC